MSSSDFRKLCDTNIARYEKAREAAINEADAQPLVPDDEGQDEHVVSSQSQKRNSQQQAPPLEATLAEREAIDSSQLNSLFMDSTPTATTNAELLAIQPPKARKHPVVQSDSSLSPSEGELTDDSMMLELGTTTGKTKRKSTAAEDPNIELRPIRKSAQPLSTALKRASTTPNPKSATNPSLSRPARSTELGKPSPPQAKPGNRNEETGTTPPQRRASSTSGPTSAATSSASSTQKTTLPGNASSGTAKRSASFTAQPSSSKTTSDTGKSGGIKIYNEPKNQPRQSSTLPKNTLFQTLKRRAAAEKMSRREGTPDLAALEFVNGPPAAVVSKPQAPRDDPYGRREPSNRRITETSQDNRSMRRESTDANAPLAPWEVDKVPLVCHDWRLSNNCRNTARECRFMHRNKDENGHDYPLGDGRIPGKYRRPPLTCWYWLNGPQGCVQLDEKCDYTHFNTGWVKHINPAIGDVQIDPDQRPVSERPEVRSREKKAKRPSQITCRFWSQGQCRKSDQECAFQHKDTGIIADVPNYAHQKSVRVADVPKVLDLPDDMDIDHTVQQDVTDEVIRIPSPTSSEQLQQPSLQLPPPPPPPPPPIELPPIKITCKQLKAAVDSVWKLNFEDMFASNDGGENVNLVERRAFVIFHPEDHFREMDIITRWLLVHHVQVGSANYPGAWADFTQQIQQGGSGIVIVRNVYFTKQTNTNYTRCIPTLSTSRIFQNSARFFAREYVSGRSAFNQVWSTTMFQMFLRYSGMIVLRSFPLVDSSISRMKFSK